METPTLYSIGNELSTEPSHFGWLRDSSDLANDTDTLKSRMTEDGYLYLPGYLNRADVIEARRAIMIRAQEAGLLEPNTEPLDGIMRTDGENPYFRPDFTQNNPELYKVLYDGPMMAFFAALFSEEVRHFDFTWLRMVGKGKGTEPHCDIVYMGRGTHNLYTVWTPLGDINLILGGLIILENSHKQKVLSDYQKQDVDTYCENGPNAEAVLTGKMSWEHWDGSNTAWNGAIKNNPVLLREELGGRWLTAPEYKMGDILIFSMRTVHASLDNQTKHLRLSSDTRYQRNSEPADERWILGPNGENPPAHGLEIKRGKIC
jgi:Phytanoyl-CoA dioxygenase (PhyH)